MDENLIISKYKSGKSLSSISKELGHCTKTMKKILIKNNIPMQPRSNGRRKFPLNDNYFEFIDIPLKAYFLGWMYSDGFVLKDGYCSGINLQKEDRVILEKFSEETFSSVEPVYDLKKARGNAKFQSRLMFKSRKFQSFLLKQGVIHNKSLTLKPPLNVPDDLLRYFILGYFEGDGCLCGGTFSIVATRSVCIWIGDYLVSKNIIDKYRVNAAENRITHRLIITSKKNFCGIYNYFYRDPPPIHLERKRLKIFEALSKTFAVKPNKIYIFRDNGFELRDKANPIETGSQ